MPSTKKPSGKEKALTGPRGGTSTVTGAGKMRVVVFLEPDERRALKVAAAQRDCSVSDLVRAALRQYIGGE